MNADERSRLLARMRALMAKTVANGATAEEELTAAAMAGKLAAQLDTAPKPQVSWAVEERKSPEYQALLEKNTLENLFKAAVQELALNHINTVSPPRRKVAGEPVEWVLTRELVGPHLSMMLGAGGSRLHWDLLSQAIEELIYDGALPERLAIPLGD